MTERLSREESGGRGDGEAEPWNQETRELNNFESWLVLLFPNPRATDQESADS